MIITYTNTLITIASFPPRHIQQQQHEFPMKGSVLVDYAGEHEVELTVMQGKHR